MLLGVIGLEEERQVPFAVEGHRHQREIICVAHAISGHGVLSSAGSS